MKIFIIIILCILILWVLYSVFSSRVETLNYKVVEKKSEYEIRQYDPYIAMQTEVSGDTGEAMNSGFRILAGYIFGDNKGNKKVAMTSPVMENPKTTVAMTAPVMEQASGDKKVITFTAPKEYTIDTLPVPNSSNIKFVQVPAKKYAVYKFTWYYTSKIIEEKEKNFLELLKNDKKEIVGVPIFAGYNPPWTIPFLMRNEILVEIN